MIIIELPGEPEGKGRPRFRTFTPKNGHAFASAYTPNKTRKYESALRSAAVLAMRSKPLLEGPLTIRVMAVFSVPQSWSKPKREAALQGFTRPAKKPDCDNVLKCIDSCNGVVFKDDAQVVDAQISKFYGAEPFLRIEVTAAK